MPIVDIDTADIDIDALQAFLYERQVVDVDTLEDARREAASCGSSGNARSCKTPSSRWTCSTCGRRLPQTGLNGDLPFSPIRSGRDYDLCATCLESKTCSMEAERLLQWNRATTDLAVPSSRHDNFEQDRCYRKPARRSSTSRGIERRPSQRSYSSSRGDASTQGSETSSRWSSTTRGTGSRPSLRSHSNRDDSSTQGSESHSRLSRSTRGTERRPSLTESLRQYHIWNRDDSSTQESESYSRKSLTAETKGKYLPVQADGEDVLSSLWAAKVDGKDGSERSTTESKAPLEKQKAVSPSHHDRRHSAIHQNTAASLLGFSQLANVKAKMKVDHSGLLDRRSHMQDRFYN